MFLTGVGDDEGELVTEEDFEMEVIVDDMEVVVLVDDFEVVGAVEWLDDDEVVDGFGVLEIDNVEDLAVLELDVFEVVELVVDFEEVEVVNVFVETATDLIVEVVVLQIGCMFLLLQDVEADNVTVVYRSLDSYVLVQLHDVIAVTLVEVEEMYVTVGVGAASTTVALRNARSTERSDNMLIEGETGLLRRQNYRRYIYKATEFTRCEMQET